MSIASPYRLVPVQRAGDTQAHLRLVAPNGETVMVSEKYDSLDNARRAAEKIADEGRIGFRVSRVRKVG